MNLDMLRQVLLQHPEAAPTIAFAAKEQLPAGETQARVFSLIDEILHRQKPVRNTG